MNLIELFDKRVVKIGLLLLLLFQFYKIPYHLLGVDAGAILPTARDVAVFNERPYIDVFTIYTPLSYYIYGILYYLFEVPPTYVVIIYNWIFLIIAALILRKGISGKYKDTIPLIFLLTTTPLAFDVKIENLAMPFLVYMSLKTANLLSLNKFYLMLRTIILIGLLSSVLFLFKQNYLILLPEVVLVLFLSKGFTTLSLKNKILILFSYATAFTCFTLLCFLLVLHFNFSGFNFYDFLTQLQGKNYDGCSPFSNINSFLDVIFSYFRYIFLLIPVIFAIVLLLPFAKGLKNLIIFTLIVFLPVNLFWFNVQPQYMFIIPPFIIIFFIAIFNNNLDSLYFNLNRTRTNLLQSVIMLTLVFYILRNHVYNDFTDLKYSNHEKDYNKFLAEGRVIQNVVGNQQNVYLGHGISQFFVYYLNFKSIDEKRVGYIFLTRDCFDNALKNMQTKGVILVKENNRYISLSPSFPVK